MGLYKRKINRLKNYNYSSNGAYFITICSENKQNIFGGIVGGGAYDAPKMSLSYIGEIADKFIISTNNIPNVSVDKYVIMPNHIHLLIFIDNQCGTSRAPSPTNDIVPHMVSTLKRFINKETGRNIFQRSYHDHIIRDENDYQRIWEYIDTNPIKWNDDCFYSEL